MKESTAFQQLWPEIADKLEKIGLFRRTSSSSAASSTTIIGPSSYPEALLRDGTRPLIGSLTVGTGVLIDGVDISEFKLEYDVHASVTAVAAHGNVGDHTHTNSSQGGLIAHSVLTGLATGDPHAPLYAGADGSGITRTAYQSERLNRAFGAGNGLTGGGTATTDLTFNVGAGDGITVNANDVAVNATVVRTTRTIDSGAGLTGGSTLSSDVTLAVGAGAGITVNANDVAINQGYSNSWTVPQTFQADITTDDVYPDLDDQRMVGSFTKKYKEGWFSTFQATVFAENTIFPIGGAFFICKDQGTLVAAINAMQTTIDFGKAMTANDFVVLRAAGQLEWIQIVSVLTGTTYTVLRGRDNAGTGDIWPQGACWANVGYNGTVRIEIDAINSPRIVMVAQGTTWNDWKEILRLGDLQGVWGNPSGSPINGLALGQYLTGKANLTLDDSGVLRMRNEATDVVRLGTDGVFDLVGDMRISGTLRAALDYITLDDDGLRILSDGLVSDRGGVTFTDDTPTVFGGIYGRWSVGPNIREVTVKAEHATYQTDLYLKAVSTGTTSIIAQANRFVFNGRLVFGGTSFPSSPSDNDLYYRTDRDLLYFYNSATTSWLTTNEYSVTMPTSTSAVDFTAGAVPIRSDYAPYITNIHVHTNPAATNSATNYWTITFAGYEISRTTGSTIHAFNTSTDTQAIWKERDVVSGFSGTVAPSNRRWLEARAAKTLSPGALSFTATIYYRLIG